MANIMDSEVDFSLENRIGAFKKHSPNSGEIQDKKHTDLWFDDKG